MKLSMVVTAFSSSKAHRQWLPTSAPPQNRLRPSGRLTRTVVPSILLFYCTNAAHSLLSFSPSLSVTGQRYLHDHGGRPSEDAPPPLLIIPGTAQTIELWQQHVPFLSKSRSVLICEPVGVGLHVPENVDMSIHSQAKILYKTLQSFQDQESLQGPFDVAGFSLGGRIAMALACLYPDKIRRLYLTGVAMQRSNWATLQIAAWKDLLNHQDTLRPFAWSALLASYSPDFLMKHQDKLHLWIDALCQGHTLKGLRQLVHQTHDTDDEDWSVEAMAKQLPTSIVGHLCVGQQDQLAPLGQVEALAETLQWPPPTVFEGAAHVPPIESPLAWRRDLEEFLNSRPRPTAGSMN